MIRCRQRQKGTQSMRPVLVLVLIAASTGCDIGQLTVGTTAKVLVRGQPALQQESDYELARQAIPGTLKTVEAFWIVKPDDANLIKLLTEGYCQYGIGFAEDDWEAAQLAHDLRAEEYYNEHATKMFTRCLNYALLSLGKRWQRDLFGDDATVATLLREDGGHGKRFAMMYAGVALGSIIQHNLTRMSVIGYLGTVEAILNHVVELDKTKPPKDPFQAALPYVVLGMIHTAKPAALGGEPDRARGYFERAIQITGGKHLLARALMGYRVGLAKGDRKFLHDQLRQVLETPPSVWPEQRLANEIAHRKARRYLSKEKELFP
jgi:hypothetical protein